MACNCTWAPNTPVPENTVAADISYSIKTEVMEVKVNISGTANTTPGQGKHAISGDVKISAYEWNGIRWQKTHNGSLKKITAFDVNCTDKNAATAYSQSVKESIPVDAAYLAGHMRLILLQVYFEVKGCGADAGNYDVFRRIGVTLSNAKPQVFSVQTTKGAYGPGGEQTDGNWAPTSPDPKDPPN